MRQVALGWERLAQTRSGQSFRQGILWKAANYLSLLATAAGGASGGAALYGSKTFAAVAAFVSAAAAAAANATASEVTRDRLRKVSWRQFENQAHAFVYVRVLNPSLDTVANDFATLEASLMHTEAAGVSNG